MKLILIHGWSSTTTKVYGELPEALTNSPPASDLDLEIQHISLSRYISFNDQITMIDLARALDAALRDLPGNSKTHIEPFSAITHSTGGPLLRIWLDHFYGNKNLDKSPLQHFIQLAPANNGSALAILGQSRLSRIKSFFSGIEPGTLILEWLQFGSDGQWYLNHETHNTDYITADIYPFTLTGQGIDENFYDFLNSYLTEPGSDGVVRVCGANLNTTLLHLRQNPHKPLAPNATTTKLIAATPPKTNTHPIALRVYNQYSHSGSKMGIMNSIKATDTQAPIVRDIIACLHINTPQAYATLRNTFDKATQKEQQQTDRYTMLVFNIRDNEQQQLGKDQYDLFLLAGNDYQPNMLPRGFLIDKQFNEHTGRLTLYLDTAKMHSILDEKIGIRIVARPDQGFIRYAPAEYRADIQHLKPIIQPNQTIYIDIVLHRNVDTNLYLFGPASQNPVDFKSQKPSGKNINNN